MRRPIKDRAKAVARPRTGERVLPFAVLVLLTALILSGCNTIGGFGEDVAATGGAIDETAERTQDEMFEPEPQQQPLLQQPTRQTQPAY